jgi:hypothetical protein
LIKGGSAPLTGPYGSFRASLVNGGQVSWTLR